MVTSQCNGYLAFYFCNTLKIDHRKKRCKKDPHLQKPLSCDPKVKLTDFQRPNRKAVRRPCSGKSGSERKKQFPKNAFLGAARGACVFHCLPLYSLLRLPIEQWARKKPWLIEACNQSNLQSIFCGISVILQWLFNFCGEFLTKRVHLI